MLDWRKCEVTVVMLGLLSKGQALDSATRHLGAVQMGGEDRCVCHRVPTLQAGCWGWREALLVTIQDKDTGLWIFTKTNKFKEVGETYARIFTSNDHPGMWKKWKQLCDPKIWEKERPKNVGYMIRLDTKEQKLYCDDIIDNWNTLFF